jgi:hypothetical protein
MASVKEHYDNLLAPYYAWISGGLELKLEENRKIFRDLDVRSEHSEVAVDLGAGSGFQSIPLAEVGFKVIAIDMNHALLAELEENAKDLSVVTIQDNLLNFTKHSPAKIGVIVCMGDTLTHLTSLEEVQNLFANAYDTLDENALLILGFRDLTLELTELTRFIPVKSNSKRIFSCFLEYEENHVKVHDIVYEKTNDRWKMRKSFFRKLRISPPWTRTTLIKVGFKIQTYDVQKEMVTIVARKP